MPKIVVIVRLIDEEGKRYENETNIDISSFRDPDLVEEANRIEVFNRVFGFLMRSAEHFVKHWARSVRGRDYFNRIDQSARTQGFSSLARQFLMSAAINSPEGSSHLELPIQVLEPKEGEDYPRPKFNTRYKRKPVV